MRFDPDSLRRLCLLAIEEAVAECRYRTPRRTIALRFALAYLWTNSDCPKQAVDDVWRDLGAPHGIGSLNSANASLLRLYRALGVERGRDVEMQMWQRLEKALGRGHIRGEESNHDRRSDLHSDP